MQYQILVFFLVQDVFEFLEVERNVPFVLLPFGVIAIGDSVLGLVLAGDR